MKLEFETPTTPNFVRVKNFTNVIPIQSLDENEFEEYLKLWAETLKNNYWKKKSQ